MPVYHSTRTYGLKVPQPRVITVTLPPQVFTQSLTGTLSFTGTFAKGLLYLRSLIATLNFVGTFSRAFTRVLAFTATLSRSAALTRRTADAGFIATFAPTGTLLKKITDSGFTATQSFIGNLASSKLFLRALTATLSFVGNLATNFIAGAHLFTQALTATLSTSAALSRKVIDGGFTATLSFLGATTKNIRKGLGGTLAFIGATAKLVRDAGFTATLSFTGFLSASKSFLKSLTATLSFVGAVSVKQVITRAFTATLSFAGTFSRRAQKAFAANFAASGSLVRKFLDAGFSAMLSFVGSVIPNFISGAGHLFTQALSATLSTSGVLTRMTGKALSAIVSTAASLVKRITRSLGGTLSFAGTMVKAIRDAGFTGALSFAGALGTAAVHFFTRAFTATTSFVGNLTRTRAIARVFTATLAMSAAISRRIGKAVAATLNFSGAIRKAIRKGLGATLTFISFLFRGGFTFFRAGQIAGATLKGLFAGSTAKIGKAGSHLEVKEMEGSARIPVTGSTLKVERTK